MLRDRPPLELQVGQEVEHPPAHSAIGGCGGRCGHGQVCSADGHGPAGLRPRGQPSLALQQRVRGYASPRAANAACTARFALAPDRPAVSIVAARAARVECPARSRTGPRRSAVGLPCRRARCGCPTARATRSRRRRAPRRDVLGVVLGAVEAAQAVRRGRRVRDRVPVGDAGLGVASASPASSVTHGEVVAEASPIDPDSRSVPNRAPGRPAPSGRTRGRSPRRPRRRRRRPCRG